MSTFVWVVGCTLGYVALALACGVLLIRTRPEWLLAEREKGVGPAVPGEPTGFGDWVLPYLVGESERRRYSYANRFPAMHSGDREALGVRAAYRKGGLDAKGMPAPPIPTWGGLSDGFLGSGMIVLSPLVVLVFLPFSIVIRATTRSVNEKIAARTALEAEMAKARAELDALFAKEVPNE